MCKGGPGLEEVGQQGYNCGLAQQHGQWSLILLTPQPSIVTCQACSCHVLRLWNQGKNPNPENPSSILKHGMPNPPYLPALHAVHGTVGAMHIDRREDPRKGLSL